MSTLRVAVIADFVEERWASMDLVAEMLARRLRSEHGELINASIVRPGFARPFTRHAPLAQSWRAFAAERILNLGALPGFA